MLKGDIDSLENVQKFALRVCMKSWNSTYEELLMITKLLSLQDRRIMASLCHLFKIVKGFTDFPDAPVHSMTHSYDTRLSDKPLFIVTQCRTNAYQHSFFPSTLANWNSLPREASQTNTIAAFKGRNIPHF